MPKPALSESAERLYDEFAPTFFREDEEYGWAGAIFVTGLCRMLDPTAAIVQPTGEPVLGSATKRNYIPNPSFVYGAAGGGPLGWTATSTYRTDSGATLETKHPGEVQVEGRKGYCVVTTSGGTSAEGIDTENVIPAIKGVPFTVHCWLWGTAGGEEVQLRLGSAATGGETTEPVTLVAGWRQYSVTFTPTSTGLMGFAVNTAGTFAYKWYIAGVSNLFPYGDGDSSGARWEGEPGDSVSLSGFTKELIRPGYAVLACPQELDSEAWLAWIGQFAGVSAQQLKRANRPGLSPEEILAVQRGWVEHPIGFQRGGDAAEELVVRSTLTGGKTIFFYPRYNGEPFLLKCVTLTSETPNPQETEEELLAVLPAWIVLEYETVTGGTYAILEAAGATYAAIEGFHATYASMEAHPEET